MCAGRIWVDMFGGGIGVTHVGGFFGAASQPALTEINDRKRLSFSGIWWWLFDYCLKKKKKKKGLELEAKEGCFAP